MQTIPGFKIVEGLPESAGMWRMMRLGHETIIAVSDDKGTYLIANGQAVELRPEPLAEPVMIEIKRMVAG